MRKIKAIIFLLGFWPLLSLAQTNIRIDNAYSREIPPSAENIAVYMTLRNVGIHGVSLQNISSVDAESVMIHLSVMENGMMTMQPMTELEIPPRTTARFEPGGLHIMLEGLRRQLRAGDLVRLNLEFSNGIVLRVDVPILEI